MVYYWEIEDEFTEYLNEFYPATEIGYSIYLAGDIVRELSPIDFRVGVSDYADENYEEAGEDVNGTPLYSLKRDD